MVAESPQARRVRTLLELLDELVRAHEELLNAVEEKIAAMRGADLDRLRAVAQQEQDLVERINDREGLRRQLTVAVAGAYGVGRDTARAMTAGQLAVRLGGLEGQRLTATAGRLKLLAANLARRNHVARLASEGVLGHLRQVFSVISVAEGDFVGYQPDGGVRRGRTQRILDAVG